MGATGRGSFGYATVLGTTSSVWEPGAYATPIMGRPVAGQHVWGALQTTGGRGLPIRHFMNEAAVRLVLYDERGDGGFVYRPCSGYAGICEVGDRDGRWGIWQSGQPPRFAFTTRGSEGYWREHDALEVTGRSELDALQFVTPDADEPLAYLARMFRVTGGECLGEAVVDGYFFHEQVYLRSGHSWVLSTHKRRLQGVWLVFVTRYTDGSAVWGQICYSEHGWSFAIVIPSEGDPILVHRPTARVDLDADGYPVTADFDLGAGGVWCWRPRRGGRIPLPGPAESTPRWAEGVLTRQDDDRSVVFAHTWWESYANRLAAARLASTVRPGA